MYKILTVELGINASFIYRDVRAKQGIWVCLNNDKNYAYAILKFKPLNTVFGKGGINKQFTKLISKF